MCPKKNDPEMKPIGICIHKKHYLLLQIACIATGIIDDMQNGNQVYECRSKNNYVHQPEQCCQ